MTRPSIRARLALTAAFVAAGLSLSGCATQIEDKASEAYDPMAAMTDNAAMNEPVSGSIYAEGSRGLFANDRRAARVGDILTVQFVESISATKSQTASAEHQSNFSATLPGVLTGGFDNALLSNGTDSSFKGQGAAQQSNSLTGRLSVVVVRSLPGGNLEILGQKKLTLNNGNEYVRLSGIVRPEDISANNVVLSDRIAAADIKYVGAGDVADVSQAGWLHRLLTTVNPM